MLLTQNAGHDLQQLQKMGGGGGGGGGAGLSDQLANMSMSQSRLGIWTDRAPGSTRQGAAVNMTSASSIHSSHSTPNLQGACLFFFCLLLILFIKCIFNPLCFGWLFIRKIVINTILEHRLQR